MKKPIPKWTIAWRGLTFLLFSLFLARAIAATRDDFLAYYHAGERALHGLSPYVTEETPFRYLPLTAYFFVPFTFFDVSVARVLFFILNFGAALSIYVVIRRRIGDFATFLVVLLFIRFHNHDFGNSQINPALLVLFFYWWDARRTNLAFSSLAFAIFGSFKLLPFALGFPLLVRGRWQEISWIALWTITLNFLPIFFYENGPLVFKDWYDHAKLIDDPVMLSNVQSLQSAMWWILEGRLSRDSFAILSRGVQAGLLLSVVVFAPKRNREAWMFAGTLAVTAFISPLAWKHNYLQLLPLVFLWFYEDPLFAEKRTKILYGFAAFGLVLAPWAIGLWNRGFADRLYFMPWTGALIVVAGTALARRAETQILPIEK